MYFLSLSSPLVSSITTHRIRCSPPRRSMRMVPLCAVKEVFMPALSSTMTEGKIVSWLKTEGEKVAKGEPIVVVESDKADMDVESFNDGILGKIVVEEGGVAGVGAPIAYLADSEADVAEAQNKGDGAASNGTAVPVAQAAAETKVEEAKLPPAPAAAPESSTPIPVAPPPPPPPPPVAVPVPRSDGRIIATPYAKKLAKELKVDLKTVAGSGPAGRITAADVENAASGKVAAPPHSVAPLKPSGAAESGLAPVTPSPQKTAPAVEGTRVSELLGTTVPFNPLEAAVAKGMIDSLAVPEFRVACSIETDAFDVLYKQLKPKGVTMTALLAKACGVALAKHPVLFAQCTSGADGITYNEHVNVAIAVTMAGGGLITPVLSDADSKDIYTMSREWADLVKRARVKKLTPAEYTSGTFTISNLGMYGVDNFDAILPMGTAGILAIGGSLPKVVATKDGLIGVKKIMQVNLTCDHRIVYGAQAAEFLQSLKSVIEHPEQLTM